MTERDNVLRLLRRQGYEHIPVDFSLCDSLVDVYRQKTASPLPYQAYFNMPLRVAPHAVPMDDDRSRFQKYHAGLLGRDFSIDENGVGHRSTPTSMHMTQMFCPLASADSVEEIEIYPMPEYDLGQLEDMRRKTEQLIATGNAAVGMMQCTIWETAWYLRGMENLMADMMDDDDIAICLLDRVTAMAERKAELYARAGVDILFLGDDIGMQRTILMSTALYRGFLKPRLRRVIQKARAIRPDILIAYHSCGFIEPFIPDLIEVGVDILNPVQPECMSYEKIVGLYQGALSFLGTIGTQTTMPFGTPQEVQREVWKYLKMTGSKGGLLPSPTHLLEPEVPWENILAYVSACRDYEG